ncbi:MULTISPECIES: electron transfer flavoprotein subunit beta/FixA family protein [unclassified Methylophilus]|jgi:electron transfer flavoprotein beta subunit|uniref:electron transfer flavoprotein subunit beta/FixA family protein n=1 Tax=unclassified Methylophilus TaxID=2630143 RepID=UPI00064858EF|nr:MULTISPECIES: electron transfer flavoprotein subunit beta/FixA family protein [unclassified Methylophilus]HCU84721.1 electron transfer flavoprotein subunit beta/FixA family protein [Methylophilus sp.]
MKALVAIKRVVDYNIQVRVKADGSNVDIDGVKMGVNPFDENAIEEAIRLKEKGIVTEIVAVTIGAAVNQDILRHALAMGADRATLIETTDSLQPLAVAKVLKAVVEREQPSLILLGKQAIDDDAGQTGQMLAALLKLPQATYASQITIADNQATVVREIDGGTQTLSVTLPAVITADLRLNEPRYVKLPNLMMARKKPIETIALDSLNLALTNSVQQLKVAAPPERPAGIMVKDVNELLSKLRTHEGIIA